MIFLILILSGTKASSQYRFELGGFAGGTSYLGDANPTSLFDNMGSSYGGLIRYNINYRSSVKVNIFKGEVLGSISNNDPNFPNIENELTFSNNYLDIGFNYEFNFFPYTLSSEPNASAISPYIFGGFGLTYISEPMFNIPFGLGVKYLLNPKINIGVEMGVRKVFSDNLENETELNNPKQLNGSAFVNNDYYTSFGFFITIGISNRTWKCKNL